jgi:circadian clock protein KaiA
LSAPLTIIILTDAADVLPLLGQYLSADRYVLQHFTSQSEFLAHIQVGKNEPDCLVFYAHTQLIPIINHLYDRGIILPLVMIQGSNEPHSPSTQQLPGSQNSYIYQPSEVLLAIRDLPEIAVAIDEAITKSPNPTFCFSNNTALLKSSKSG